ncbi:hypothetical protein JKP75_15000 [Blastococcus sp. TML/M2B]|uniref:hypothetical protein n=1 Tax=unclassified Blastococcus TaxID=2619396 RepID=UPI0019095F97|nr:MULTISPECIES: hypothetical protein [unclassified Blastococcus]MBN1093744.1 hypothetical protein [Blastococcus sp. TML/M2B]MBN1096135.1 hypothetical protein [Blastococcus sp. TML/C7B]
MISTTWTDAPAGFSGRGATALPALARPAVAGGPAVLMAPTAAPIQGCGLPAVRLRRSDERDVATRSYLAQAVIGGTAPNGTTTHDFGITLGIHSPGRPLS